ncbi:unnamed protein product [Ectocarpus sp. CCAP 1310/34]|nr:unnamed protein product [Ectocarpus sp. CCAP 1310/34]
MEVDQHDDPYPQAVVLSQTCWEYKTLLDQESAPPQRRQPEHGKRDESRKSIALGTPPSEPRWAKKAKTSASSSVREPWCAGMAPLATLRQAGKGETSKGVGSWDIFVLVLQASGLEQVTSKRGSEVDFGTLLVADQSLSFFRLTLWGRTARAGGRLVRAGDLVRFNGIGVSSFQGTVQACSTRKTSFRVVWRGDAFTTPQEAPSTTMLPLGRPPPASERSPLSQGGDLAVSREAACALAAWAKTEFPSITSPEPPRGGGGGGGGQHLCNRHAAAPGVSPLMEEEGGVGADSGDAAAAGDAAFRPGSLGAARNGVGTTVRACVVEVSEVERLWMWESAGGKRRKDLVSRATALLTDGRHEMTLQLWGDMASDETIDSLRGRAIAAGKNDVSAHDRTMERPAVFEFTRLQPSFSFSCETLVLNGKSGTVTQMDRGSAEAVSVSTAVLASAAAAAAGEGDERAPVSLATAKSSCAGSPSFLAQGAGAPASARRFESVAALMSADGFSGAGYLDNVVVRKVCAPWLSAAGSPDEHGRAASLPSLGGVAPPVVIYLGDLDEPVPAAAAAAAGTCDAWSAGVEAVVGVTADGGALHELLGGVPLDLLAVGSGRGSRRGMAGDVGRGVVQCLLDGLEVGGRRGERVDVALACSASADENGRFIPGGSSYRLISLLPKYEWVPGPDY